nr:receptor-like protein 12 [Ipomoea batatas]
MFTKLPPFLYLVIFLCFSSSAFTQRVAAKNNIIRCPERERQALLDFKHGLVDEDGVLSTWGSDVDQRECCNWWGVHCHNNTGHVTMLDIHDPVYDYGFPTQQFQDNFSIFPSHPYLKGYKVSPSLLELEHLKYVDLSHIDFQGIRFPGFFSSFKRLRVLKLMYTSFSGIVPPRLGNLTNLHVLHVSGPDLKIKNVEWLSLLSSLRSLYLYAIDIDAPPTNVSLSPFLEKLRLPSCELHGTLPFLLNSSPFLSIVDFSYNRLTLPIFHLLHNASKQFTSIDLSHNNFLGPIPDTFGDMSILENLYLGDNSFTGETPKSFENLTHLQILSLGGNHLKESIVELLEKLSKGIRQSSLQTLDLSENRLIGELPKDIGTRFPSLRELGLRGNQLQGVLPESIGKLSMLEQLDASSNSLQGIVRRVPHSLGSLSLLRSLHLRNNHLTGKIFSTIYQMENLEVLDLSKNHLFGAIPIGLASLNYLAVLDLSNNSLSGKIPTGTQLQSFSASFYAGNSGLCGDPLPKCSPDAPPQNNNNNNNHNDYEEGDDFLDQGFYISMVLGFSLSFWGFVVTLILKDSWRLAYYEFLNDVKDWLYVKMRIYLARLQRKLGRT